MTACNDGPTQKLHYFNSRHGYGRRGIPNELVSRCHSCHRPRLGVSRQIQAILLNSALNPRYPDKLQTEILRFIMVNIGTKHNSCSI